MPGIQYPRGVIFKCLDMSTTATQNRYLSTATHVHTYVPDLAFFYTNKDMIHWQGIIGFVQAQFYDSIWKLHVLGMCATPLKNITCPTRKEDEDSDLVSSLYCLLLSL